MRRGRPKFLGGGVVRLIDFFLGRSHIRDAVGCCAALATVVGWASPSDCR